MDEQMVAQFWKRVDKSGGADACWVWTGGREGGGYGQLSFRGTWVKAHRLSWEIHNGFPPGALCTLHRCDNPPCVNPAHLFLGTRADNNRDKAEKGRACKGERSVRSKLTDKAVREIRAMLAGGATTRATAAHFGIRNHGLMSQIRHGKRWGHVT